MLTPTDAKGLVYNVGVGRLNFIRSTELDTLSSLLAERISTRLETGRVTWLLSGGSSIDLAVKTRVRLVANLSNLTVSLIDERFGPAGHADSNWQQLGIAGFDFNGLNGRPVLTGKDISHTVSEFNVFLSDILSGSGYIMGLFGMGADGHTAGILPGSSAVGSAQLATSYLGPDYERITVTPRFIKAIDEAYLYAAGSSKIEQIKRLKASLPTEDQPAQALKQAKTLVIIGDYEGVDL